VSTQSPIRHGIFAGRRRSVSHERARGGGDRDKADGSSHLFAIWCAVKRGSVHVLLAIAPALAVGAVAHAQSEPADGAGSQNGPTLIWDAPVGCPTAAAVLGNVERTLADPGRARARVPLAATAHVSVASGEAWQASLILAVGGTRTERRFEAESCEAVAAAAALIIALAVDGGLEPPAPASSSRVVAGPQGLPPERREPRVGPQLFLTANGLVDWRTLPQPSAPGLEASVGWKGWVGERWRARLLGGVAFFPTRQLPYSSAEVFGDWWLLDVSARGCVSLAVWRVEIGPCLGGEVGIMHASASFTSKDTLPSGFDAWFSLLGSALMSLNVSRTVAIFSRADLVVPVYRPSFGTRDKTSEIPLYRIPAFAFRAGVGIEWAFR
jgi:hypothetical protein